VDNNQRPARDPVNPNSQTPWKNTSFLGFCIWGPRLTGRARVVSLHGRMAEIRHYFSLDWGPGSMVWMGSLAWQVEREGNMDWITLLIPLKIVVFCVILVVIYRMLSGWNSIKLLKLPGFQPHVATSMVFTCCCPGQHISDAQTPKLRTLPHYLFWQDLSPVSPGSRETELWVIHKMSEKAIDYDFDSCYNDDWSRERDTRERKTKDPHSLCFITKRG